MGKKRIAIIVALIIIILLIPFVIYLFIQNQSSENNIDGPNPTEEYQAFLNDTITTKIYIAILPCEDCDGTEIALSISQEEDSDSGTFTLSKTRLGTSDDVSVETGAWIMHGTEDDGGTILVLNISDGEIERYLQNSDGELILVDDGGENVLINGEKIILEQL